MAMRSKQPRVVKAAPSCFTCQSRAQAEWCVLGQEELALIDAAKRPTDYPTGSTLYLQGDACDAVFCIESGSVALRRTDAQGNSILVRMAHAGQTVGYRGFFANGAHPDGAEVIQPATVCRIDVDTLRQALNHNPGLGLRFLSHLCQDLEDTEEALLRQSALPVRIRLVHLLLTLKERFGTMEQEGALTIDLPMSRQDMAALLGTRPETIARALRELEDTGVAEFRGRIATVPDLDVLLDELEPLPA